jgi:hypothetical protein
MSVLFFELVAMMEFSFYEFSLLNKDAELMLQLQAMCLPKDL